MRVLVFVFVFGQSSVRHFSKWLNCSQSLPLHYASKRNPVVVPVLLEAGAKVNVLDDIKRSPLFDAARHNQEASVVALMAASADPHLGESPLTSSDVSEEMKALIKRLLMWFDILLFGREDLGLPDSIIDKSDFLISIFMPNIQTGNNDQKGVRSLNLSVACGIAIYEAHKQINFQHGN